MEGDEGLRCAKVCIDGRSLGKLEKIEIVS